MTKEMWTLPKKRFNSEEIIHKLREISHIAIDGLAAALHIFGRQPAGFEQPRPAQNGMQRGTQLVPQGGQEFILEATDAFGFRAQRPLVGETLAQILGFLIAVAVHQPIIAPRASAGR